MVTRARQRTLPPQPIKLNDDARKLLDAAQEQFNQAFQAEATAKVYLEVVMRSYGLDPDLAYDIGEDGAATERAPPAAFGG